MPPLAKTVLLVEDDEDVREGITAVLLRCGYRVIAARHGGAGLDALRAESTRPALILLDWMMPVMNGLEFLDRIQREPAARGVPVVVLTATDRVGWAPGI